METPWRIELLGGLRAVQGKRALVQFRTQKTAGLLAYLAYHRERAHPRSVLMELFWPEARLEAARHSLSVALSSLRQQFESEEGPSTAASFFLADHNNIQLNPALVTTDVAEFDAALKAADAEGGDDSTELLSRAVSLFRGELLPSHYEDWVIQERQWLTERFFQGTDRLVAALERHGNLARAVEIARRGISIDPLREEVHRHLIRLSAAAGRVPDAIRQYRELERLLQQELGAEPHEETRALVAAIAAATADQRPTTDDRRPRTDDEERAERQDHRFAAVPPSAVRTTSNTEHGARSTEHGAQHVALLYKRGAQPDERLLRLLELRLREQGLQVFVDRHLTVGVEWAREIERQVRSADAVIPLLSAAAISSEMLAYEIQTAHEAAKERGGRPQLLPVRLRYAGALPEPLAAILDPLEYFLWEGPQDDQRLVHVLLEALANDQRPASDEGRSPLSALRSPSDRNREQGGAPPSGARWSSREHAPAPGAHGLERAVASFPGGVLPLDSPFYVEREADNEFHAAIARGESIVRIQGARQMGKTSLLARGLQRAREDGARVVLTDFQALDPSDLESVDRLLPALGAWLADQLDLDLFPGDVWRPHLGASVNFERYLRREVLERLDTPLVWGLDEVDRLFAYDCGGQIFGLFRSWHNRRGLDPSGPWAQLTLAMAYATEAHLFITDLNQSPFNVGARVTLADFGREQLADLNRRYGEPLRSEAELVQFHTLVNGHPYLTNRGLWEMATRGLPLAAFEAHADRDEGVFGDHLRRMLVLLVKDATLCDALRDLVQDGSSMTHETYYRLRSAGVIAGESPQEARPRCPIYAAYLKRHLL